MSISVHQVPGYVLVQCGDESVLIAGTLISPPGGGGPTGPHPNAPSGSATGPAPPTPDSSVPIFPKPISNSIGGVSVTVATPYLGHLDFDLNKTISPLVDGLLRTKPFKDLALTAREPYVMVVSPYDQIAAADTKYMTQFSRTLGQMPHLQKYLNLK